MAKRAKDELPEGWLDKEFGYLTVKKFLYSRYGLVKGRQTRIDFFVECLCICGKLHPVNSRMLQKKKVKSCGCSKGLILSQSRVKETNKEGLNPLYFRKLAQYVTRCNQKKIPWELTNAQAIDMFQLPCTYCGRQLISNTFIQGIEIIFPCNGIDRIDPTKGYTLGNVITACDDCNTAKTNIPLEDFLSWKNKFLSNYDKIRELIEDKLKGTL